jgi:hypothetical protein
MQDQRLLSHLRLQWDKPMRLTTLEQGMDALGQPRNAARRLRLGGYLLTHRDVHPAVAQWGARPFLLNEDEKLRGPSRNATNT